jgi:hypothetical protein
MQIQVLMRTVNPRGRISPQRPQCVALYKILNPKSRAWGYVSLDRLVHMFEWMRGDIILVAEIDRFLITDYKCHTARSSGHLLLA